MYNKEVQKRYRERNKERIKEYQQQYYKDKIEERKAYKKEYYEKTKEALNAGKSTFHICIRIENEKFDLLKKKLSKEGKTAADLVREAINEYLQKHE